MKIIVDALPTDPKECLFSKWDKEFGYVCRLCKDCCNVSLCRFLSCSTEVSTEPKCTCKRGIWTPEQRNDYVLHRCSNCQSLFKFSYNRRTGNYYPDKYCNVCGSLNVPNPDFKHLYEVEDNET